MFYEQLIYIIKKFQSFGREQKLVISLFGNLTVIVFVVIGAVAPTMKATDA